MLAMLTSNPAQSCYSATPLESQHTLKRARATQAKDSKGYDKYSPASATTKTSATLSQLRFHPLANELEQ